jgi:hypothetical protein
MAPFAIALASMCSRSLLYQAPYPYMHTHQRRCLHRRHVPVIHETKLHGSSHQPLCRGRPAARTELQPAGQPQNAGKARLAPPINGAGLAMMLQSRSGSCWLVEIRARTSLLRGQVEQDCPVPLGEPHDPNDNGRYFSPVLGPVASLPKPDSSGDYAKSQGQLRLS